MPIDGEKLDELLSGFVDDQLSSAERREVEEALAADARLREKLADLRRQAVELRAYGQFVGSRAKLPADFAERVVAAAQRAQPPKELAAEYPLNPSSSRARWRSRSLIVGLAAMAAALLLAIYVPLAFHSEDEPRQALAEPDSQPAAGTYVNQGDVEAWTKFTYVLVIDVQMTRQALENGVLSQTLLDADIRQAGFVTATPTVLTALDQTRMIVRPQADEAADTILYVIRADMQDIDAALEQIWADGNNFPGVSFDVAIDTRAELVRELLRGLNQPFSSTESFAVPLVMDREPGEVSAPTPFPGTTQGVKYVSRGQRAQGWAAETWAVGSADSMSTVLLVGHIVD